MGLSLDDYRLSDIELTGEFQSQASQMKSLDSYEERMDFFKEAALKAVDGDRPIIFIEPQAIQDRFFLGSKVDEVKSQIQSQSQEFYDAIESASDPKTIWEGLVDLYEDAGPSAADIKDVLVGLSVSDREKYSEISKGGIISLPDKDMDTKAEIVTALAGEAGRLGLIDPDKAPGDDRDWLEYIAVHEATHILSERPDGRDDTPPSSDNFKLATLINEVDADMGAYQSNAQNGKAEISVAAEELRAISGLLYSDKADIMHATAGIAGTRDHVINEDLSDSRMIRDLMDRAVMIEKGLDSADKADRLLKDNPNEYVDSVRESGIIKYIEMEKTVGSDGVEVGFSNLDPNDPLYQEELLNAKLSLLYSNPSEDSYEKIGNLQAEFEKAGSTAPTLQVNLQPVSSDIQTAQKIETLLSGVENLFDKYPQEADQPAMVTPQPASNNSSAMAL